MDNQEIYDIINIQTKILVGQICKRVEVLEQNNSLQPTLFKALAKEQIYEWSRTLIAILKIGKTVFITCKENEKNGNK